MLPFTMSLAAGAMIYVVCDSLVPEMQAHGNKALAMQARAARTHPAHHIELHPLFRKACTFVGAQGLMFGFVIMMVLDVALG